VVLTVHGPTRRSFLQRLGIGTATAALPAVALAAKAIAPPAVSEDPALLTLNENLLKAINHARAAEARAAHALAEFNRLKPSLPPELITTGVMRRQFSSEREVDVFGKDVWPIDPIDPQRFLPVRQLFTVQSLSEDIPKWSARSKNGRFLRGRLKIARAYEADLEHAATATNIADAHLEAFDAVMAACRIISGSHDVNGVVQQAGLIDIPARSLQGLLIKARAAEFMSRLDIDHQYGLKKLGLSIAHDVIRVLGTTA
jgi:hypothetical protein